MCACHLHFDRYSMAEISWGVAHFWCRIIRADRGLKLNDTHKQEFLDQNFVTEV